MANRFLLRGDNTGTPGTVVDDVGVISWTLTGTATQQSATNLFGAGAFEFASVIFDADRLESSAFSWSGAWTLSLWIKVLSTYSGQARVLTYGESDVAGSFSLIISPGSFATLPCWSGGGVGDDCGFTSTPADFAQASAAGGARVVIEYDGANITWGIENASGSVVQMGTPFAFTVATGKSLTFGSGPTDVGHTTFTGGWDGFCDSIYGTDGGRLYGSYPIAAPTSEYTTGAPPVITRQPKSQSIASGATAAFTVAAQDATGYDWQDDRTGAFASVPDGTGGTTASYTTTATTQSHQGRRLRVVVSNASGSTTSDVAQLGVVGFPVHMWSTAVQSGVDVWLRDPTAVEAGGAITGAGQIASAEAFGQPAVGAVISPAGISSAEALGSPIVAAQIAPAGIASGEALGSPAVGAAIAAAGIASGEAVGAPALAAVINAAGIASAEAFGSPEVGVNGIAAAGIPSAEAFGAPLVAAQVSAAAIPTAEAIGAPVVGAGIGAAGISSGEVFGQPALAAAIEAAGIGSAESLGQPTVGVVGIVCVGIASEEAFGFPTIEGGTPATDDSRGGIDRTDGYPRGGKRSRNREPDWLKPSTETMLQALRDAIREEAEREAAQRELEALQARQQAAERLEEQRRLLMQSQAQVAAMLGEQIRAARLQQIEQARADALLLEEEEAVALLLML